MFREEKIKKDVKLLVYKNKIFVEFYSHQKDQWIIYSIRKNKYSNNPYVKKRIFKLKKATPESINKFISKLEKEKSMEYTIEDFCMLKSYFETGFSYKVFGRNIKENLKDIFEKYLIAEIKYKDKYYEEKLSIVSKKYLPKKVIDNILKYINSYKKIRKRFPKVVAYIHTIPYQEDLYTVEITKNKKKF